MRILNAYIEEFGCFEDRSFDFSEGFNLITGDNESGKSTLLTFIKFVLYGMPRKTQENAAERERSISSKSGRASGSLTLKLENGDVYTVERRGVLRSGEKRESYSEECRIIDGRSGGQVHKGAVPGELFLGVPMGVFESTCFVRQMRNTEIDGDAVGDSLSNMLLSADESLDLQKALDRLDAVRKSLLHKSGKGGSLALLSDEIEDLEVRLDRAKADSARILSCTEAAETLKKSAMDRRRELDKLDIVFTAYNSISVIKRFENLHERQKNLDSLKESVKKYKDDHSVDGTLPRRDLAARANETARSYKSALDASALAERRLEAARAARDGYRPRSRLSADDIRNRGGIEAVCRGLDDLEAKGKKKKKLAVTFTVLALITVLLGAAAVALLSELLFVGLSLCGVAAVMLAVGISMFSASKKLFARLSEEFDRLGVSQDDGTAAVRAYLSLVFEDERMQSELEGAIAPALSASELRRADLDIAEAEVKRVLSEWRVSSSEDSVAALTETAERVREYYEGLDELLDRERIEESAVSTLTFELSEYNEADLRARIPSELIENYSSGEAAELDRRRRFCSSSLRSITEKQISAERELIRLESESEDPARVATLLEKAKKKYSEEKLRYDSAVAAYEALSAAGANIRDSVTPVIRRSSGDYLSGFTSGRYDSLGIENGCIAVAAEGKGGRSKLETLSAGTRDAAYLSLRLALLELLFRSEIPPLAMDEALSQLDDGRAAGVLSMLTEFSKEKGQCLLFTCHRREGELLPSSTEVNRIAL